LQHKYQRELSAENGHVGCNPSVPARLAPVVGRPSDGDDDGGDGGEMW
jgi:hypothetical protein